MLQVKGIEVRLGGQEILRGVDLSVTPGQVLGLLGPSGAGKSTLFRVIAGELTPARGTVLLADVDVTARPLWQRARAGLGYVPQTPSVLFDLTVADNVRVFARAARRDCGPVEERLAGVGLEHRWDVRARELSGGERRRLELLRALLAEPKVLVCDEPLSGVDPTGAGRLGKILRAVAEGGTGVLVADHRVHEALGFCDRAALLVDGRLELETAASEFLDHPAVVARYLG